MKRIHAPRRSLIAAVTATVAAGATAAAAGTGPAAAISAQTARAQTIQIRHTSLGKVLVDSTGFTLFRFSKDSGKKNTCVTTSECSTTWPALTTSGRPAAGAGVSASLLSTITLPGGTHQVTYDGHPLYRYAAATERGEAGYAGVRQFGGIWYAVSASGANVK
jgi:predicted lipoprotein with Yx(FWY)xxD motif